MSDTAFADPTDAVLTLFAEDLASIKFPDVDSASLLAAADDVARAQDALAACEAELQAAHTLLAARRDVLQQKAARALAYARIYAESNEALREKVDSIWLARSTTPSGRPVEVVPPAKRRGRPPKIAAVETLPGVEARSAS
jgi:hypothetical protein